MNVIPTRSPMSEFLDRMVREEKLVAGRIEQLVPERVRRVTATVESGK